MFPFDFNNLVASSLDFGSETGIDIEVVDGETMVVTMDWPPNQTNRDNEGCVRWVDTRRDKIECGETRDWKTANAFDDWRAASIVQLAAYF